MSSIFSFRCSLSTFFKGLTLHAFSRRAEERLYKYNCVCICLLLNNWESCSLKILEHAEQELCTYNCMHIGSSLNECRGTVSWFPELQTSTLWMAASALSCWCSPSVVLLLLKCKSTGLARTSHFNLCTFYIMYVLTSEQTLWNLCISWGFTVQSKLALEKAGWLSLWCIWCKNWDCYCATAGKGLGLEPCRLTQLYVSLPPLWVVQTCRKACLLVQVSPCGLLGLCFERPVLCMPTLPQ